MTTAAESSRFILDRIGQVLAEQDSSAVNECVALIGQAKKVFVYGVGRSGLVARAFAMRLVQLGLEVYFIGETITPIVSAGDLVVIVSNTGTTMSAVQTANIARRVGASVVSVTASKTSKLAAASNIVLHVKEETGEGKAKHAPLATLFEQTASRWAGASADAHRWRGLAIYGVDGSALRVPDTPENDGAFGRPGTTAARPGSSRPPTTARDSGRPAGASAAP